VPLSPPAAREEIHARRLVIKGYRRQDGLFDVEANLEDAKPFAYDLIDKRLAPGEPVHGMWLRLTLDRDSVVRDAEAWTEHGPYVTCAAVEPNYKALIGLKIGPGWNRRGKERMGGVSGCTHMTEMLAQMGTAALQAMWPELDRRKLDETDAPRPGLIDSCHTYRRDGEMVKRLWPEHRRGPDDRA
jgi:hypothetical protein